MEYVIYGIEGTKRVAFDLDKPDTWPTEVWVAFERAQHERLASQIKVTDDRRHAGNTLVHPGVKLSELAVGPHEYNRQALREAAWEAEVEAREHLARLDDFTRS